METPKKIKWQPTIEKAIEQLKRIEKRNEKGKSKSKRDNPSA